MAFIRGAIHRHSAQSDVDFYPTPPWATRALIEHILGKANFKDCLIYDPCCGAGHMSRVLEEYAENVMATDLYEYGFGEAGHDFLTTNLKADWIFMNPPFNQALEFVLHALPLAERGVAVLIRTQWIEGKERFESLFSKNPPTYFCPFVERVAMLKGRYDPNATTAMSYSWFVWLKTKFNTPTFVKWIPPSKDSLTKIDDEVKYAGVFDGNDVGSLDI